MGRRRSYLVLTSLIVAGLLRFSYVFPGYWQQPWTPHHFDEHFLPYEALALWEGVTPREVGWPASTFRLLLSACYGVWLLFEQGPELVAGNLAESMSHVARWIGGRVADSSNLYVIGRSLSATIGLLHVLSAIVAARLLAGPGAAVIAGALTAVSPIAVTHSQLVLADVLGAACVTLALAYLPAGGHGRSPLVAGVLMGLATASKFHFGIWLIAPIAAATVTLPGERDVPVRTRVSSVLAILIAFALTVLAFVPWLSINPVLAMKEFAVVVLSKAGGGATGVPSALANAWTVLGGLGPPILFGGVVGLWYLRRQMTRPLWMVAAVTVLAVCLLSASGLVFDRHGLLLIPGVTLLVSTGLQRLVQRRSTLAETALALVVLAAGVMPALRALDTFRLASSYHVAHAWLLKSLPDNASVVVYSEDNQYLPRASLQLQECSRYISSDDAYREKWRTNGVSVPEGSGNPMRPAVLADEQFHAFWCAREAMAPRAPAFVVHRFHAEPRFQTMTTRVMERAFREGLADDSRGFDAVLVHWNLFPDLRPARTFESAVGPTLRLYLRPGLRLRPAPAP